MKKLLLTVMCVAAIHIAATAQSGTAGDLTWTLSGNTLTISGQGEMPNYEYDSQPWYSYRSSIYYVVIEEGVTSVGNCAFYSHTSLRTVTLPEGLTTIGNSAFRDCNSSYFTSITLPEGLTTIGSNAFYDCTRLATISIPESVTSVGTDVFNNTVWYNKQSGLVYVGKVAYKYVGTMPANTQIEILEGTLSINASAFSNCTGLTKITIPESVTDIGYSAFNGCSGLTEITIPEGIKTIAGSTFKGCSGLTEITIPEGVETIYSSAFNGCSRLIEITIPEGVETIYSSTFYGCTELTKITIPESVTSIGTKAFYGCNKLADIQVLNNGLIDISLDAFDQTAWYNSTAGVLYLGTIAYRYNGSSVGISIKEGTTTIANGAFSDSQLQLVRYVTIPRSVTTIGSNAFSGCTYLTAITIPENVKSIGNNAFSTCTRLETVTWLAEDCVLENPIFPTGNVLSTIEFGKTVRTIPAYICKDNTNLSSVTLPHSVESIGKEAFFRCTDLYSLVIGGGLKEIGDLAFYGCTDLSNITCFAPTPPTATPYCFLDVPITATVRIPCGTIPSYEAADEWKYFWSFTEIIAYTASGYSANMEYGTVSVSQTCAEAVFTAEAADGCYFVRWSNGSDVNPLVVPLAEDMELVAEFETESTGIDILESNSVQVFPNPVVDKLNIESGELHVESVEILDISGKKYLTFNHQPATQLNVSTLPSGIYFVKIETTEGVFVKKFMK